MTDLEFIEFCNAIADIKSRELWRCGNFDSFASYMASRGISEETANQLIEQVKVGQN